MNPSDKGKKAFWIAMATEFGIPLIIAVITFFITLYHQLPVKENILFTSVGFILPLIVVDMVKRNLQDTSGSIIRRKHFLDKTIKQGDDVIMSVLSHFTEDCYNRCSNFSDKCADCKNFSQECNGLIRNYLYETIKNLEDTIKKSKKGEYELSTKIERFHTLAIDHLLGTNSKSYSVMHWLEHEAKDAAYNDLDYDFLTALLTKVTQPNGSKKPYYEKKSFKIRWLLIGDIEDMKNTFDYIFWVINKLNIMDEDIKKLFDFRVVSKSNYSTINRAEINVLSDFGKDIFAKEPSVGIFGEYFMFVDAEDSEKHGTIYTKMYKDKDSDKYAVPEAVDFFDKAFGNSQKLQYTNLKTKYEEILSQDSEHEEKLEGREKKKTYVR